MTHMSAVKMLSTSLNSEPPAVHRSGFMSAS
jgi:hypothetical protein